MSRQLALLVLRKKCKKLKMLRDLGKAEGQPQGLHGIQEFPCRELPQTNHVTFQNHHGPAGRICAAQLYFVPPMSVFYSL